MVKLHFVANAKKKYALERLGNLARQGQRQAGWVSVDEAVARTPKMDNVEGDPTASVEATVHSNSKSGHTAIKKNIQKSKPRRGAKSTTEKGMAKSSADLVAVRSSPRNLGNRRFDKFFERHQHDVAMDNWKEARDASGLPSLVATFETLKREASSDVLKEVDSIAWLYSRFLEVKREEEEKREKGRKQWKAGMKACEDMGMEEDASIAQCRSVSPDSFTEMHANELGTKRHVAWSEYHTAVDDAKRNNKPVYAIVKAHRDVEEMRMALKETDAYQVVKALNITCVRDYW